MDHAVFMRAIGSCISQADARALRRLLEEHREMVPLVYNGRIREIDYAIESVLMHVKDDAAAIDLCHVLIEFGADVNASQYVQSKVGAIVEASRRSLELVKLLHRAGAWINHDLFGKQASWPLLVAAHQNQLDIARYLVENGAVVNFVNIHGLSPLDYTANLPEMAAYLRSLGAKPGAELPQDHLPSNEPPPPDPTFASIREHLANWFGEVEDYPLREIVPGDPPLTLLKVPHWDGGYVGIATNGMSARAMKVPEGETDAVRRAELLVLLPPEWPLTEESMKEDRFRWPIEWLRQIARWPFETDSYLRRANIIANGEPPVALAEDTTMTCLMVRAGASEDWGQWKRPDGEIVDLMVMTPLYTSEREFELANGLPALLERMNASAFRNLVWPDRPSFMDE
jgi:hypothetical protein